MTSETVQLVVTALPNGMEADGRLKLSILLSPRLTTSSDEPEQHLDDFDDFRNWPNKLREHTTKLTVTLGDSKHSVTFGPDAWGDALDPDLWTHLLPPNTTVSAFSYTDYSNYLILSYPVARLYGYIRDLYAGVAAQYSDEPPALPQMQHEILGTSRPETPRQIDPQTGSRSSSHSLFPPADTLDIDNTRKALTEPAAILNGLRNAQQSGATLPDTLSEAVRRFQLYHRPLQKEIDRQHQPDREVAAVWKTFNRVALPSAQQVRNDLQEFHAVVSSANRFSWLQRKMGLVLDVTVGAALAKEVSDVVANNPFRVSARLTWEYGWRREDGPVDHPATLPSIEPATMCRLDFAARRFFAVSKPNSLISEGYLKLESSNDFGVVTVDLDGAVMKLKNQALGLEQKVSGHFDHDADQWVPPPEPLSALRSGGFMVAHFGRAGAVQAMLGSTANLFSAASSTTWSKPSPVVLHADDVTRGFAVDIMDLDKTGKGTWRSLCERSGTYSITGIHPVTAVDEQPIQLAMTASADDTNTDILKLYEALFIWKGWSLAVRPMGGSIKTDDSNPGVVSGANQAVATPQESASEMGDRMKIDMHVPDGSLPSLRFGRSYRARARVVDLANNAIPRSQDGSSTRATAATPYLRFEPVGPPAITLVDEVFVPAPVPDHAGEFRLESFEGESMDRLAIRTFNGPQATGTQPEPIARRLIAPPRVAVDFAELHGSLDLAGTGKTDGSATMWQLLCDKDSAFPEKTVISPQGASGTVFAKARYQAASINGDVPYLPDPFAIEVAAYLENPRDKQEQPIEIKGVSYYKQSTSWPHATPIQLVLQSGSLSAAFDPDAHTLVVSLPQGETRRLRLSHRLSAQQLDWFGQWRWAVALLDNPSLSGDRKKMLANFLKFNEAQALKGLHEMLTPSRHLTLVHAVQRPLRNPVPKLDPRAGRNLGETFARPTFTAPLDLKSTSKIDVLGVWNEPEDHPDRDDPAAPGPQNVPAAGHAFEIKISRSLIDKGSIITNPGGSTYEARMSLDEEKLAQIDLSAAGSAAVDAQAGVVPKHELGNTRYRQVRYEVQASSRFREYMPPDKRNDEDVRISSLETSTETFAWIPNSSPLPAPDIVYVVPTFGWQRLTGVAGTDARYRQGGGLRVYLRRPWLVSGYHEMLAVTLPPQSASDGDELDHYVTRWGGDPVFTTAPVVGRSPKLTMFPARITKGPVAESLLPGFAPKGENLPGGQLADIHDLPIPRSLPDATAGGQIKVDVAPHYVQYDPARQLWFCDIVIDPGQTYCPFVRLALARYHPISTAGAHLSGAVRADFAQLAPDRWVVVTPEKSDAKSRRICVYGHDAPPMAASVGNRQPQQGVFSVVLQAFLPQLGEDFGWFNVPGVPMLTTFGPADAGTPAGSSNAGSSNAASAVPSEPIDLSIGTQNFGAITVGIAKQVKFPKARASTAWSTIKATTPANLAAAVDKTIPPPDLTLLQRGAAFPWPEADAVTLLDQTLKLPGDLPADGRFRLLVQEWEYWRADVPVHQASGLAPMTPRCVFAETVEISLA